ncbi:MAG TPA: nicotinate (nicotinamide) nucleotide adenylyltransferase [Chitinophagaceae bacterium]|nr:nicotinate (nicotinamide) nucleotide adenylyltransferase [Chitinophagaceae bacterium]
MKIGLYFGSFNPIHIGHLIIANHVAQETDLQQVWFVISPQNPFKVNHSMLNEYHRLHLVRLAIADEKNLKASDIEFRLPKPSYTVTTLQYLEEKYPEHQFAIIMGSDSLQNLNKWKNAEVIMNRYPLYVYTRPGFDIRNDLPVNKTVLKAPLLEISSTHIRELIKNGKSIRYLVPDAVKEEIESNHYYKT